MMYTDDGVPPPPELDDGANQPIEDEGPGS